MKKWRKLLTLSIDKEKEASLKKSASIVSIITACILTLIKIYAAFITGSLSVLSSMIDSLSDIFASLVTYVAVRYSGKPFNKNHRYGYGKAEAVSALFQAAFIAGSAIFILYDGFYRFFYPIQVEQTVFGVVIAFAYYNLRSSYSVSSGFSPILGNTTEKKWFKGFIDTLTVFAITGGCAGSLGYGLLQISSGLNAVFGIPATTWTYIAICVFIVVMYNVSSVTGMNRGIRWLSDKNAWAFLIMMVLAFLFGPGQWICNLFTESIGDFLSGFVKSITAVSAFNDAGQAVGSVWHQSSELWPQWWDHYYFVDFLSFGPIVGLFCIKLAKGRTLRQFVVMNWLVPSVFGIIWFAIFGGLALDIQYNFAAYADKIDLQGCASLFDYMQQFGNEAMMLKVIEVIPFATVLKPMILLLIVVSFVTMADSTTSTVALMSIQNNAGVTEAPTVLKIMWGLIMGLAALVFTLTGSIDGIKIIKTIAGFPILIVGVVMMVMFLVYIVKNGRSKTVKEMMNNQ